MKLYTRAELEKLSKNQLRTHPIGKQVVEDWRKYNRQWSQRQLIIAIIVRQEANIQYWQDDAVRAGVAQFLPGHTFLTGCDILQYLDKVEK